MTRQLHERVVSPARLEALHRAGVLDTSPNSRLDRITRLASALLGTPVSLVSLVDIDRQVFVGQTGLPEPWASRGETPLSHSFCQHVVADGSPLVISDARQDTRVMDNLAIRDLDVIAYCGVPLTTSEGHTLGSFCVIDGEPRDWTAAEVQIVRDLAALVQGELALSELEVAGGSHQEVLAGLAHDVRGMVHGLVGGARTLAREPDMSAEMRDQLIGVVERQADHLSQVMEQLLDTSQPGGAATVRQPVDIGSLLEDVVAGYRLAGIARVELGEVPHASVAADGTGLRRCVSNLVENALKHSDGASVRVCGEVVDSTVRVTVADDGPGVPRAEQDTIFERGGQADASGGGRGLGLHIVRTLVTSMGGTVSLSSGTGEGARFTIELPAA